MSTKLRQRFQDHDRDRDSSIRAIGLRGCFSGEKKEGGGKKIEKRWKNVDREKLVKNDLRYGDEISYIKEMSMEE